MQLSTLHTPALHSEPAFRAHDADTAPASRGYDTTLNTLTLKNASSHPFPHKPAALMLRRASSSMVVQCLVKSSPESRCRCSGGSMAARWLSRNLPSLCTKPTDSSPRCVLGKTSLRNGSSVHARFSRPSHTRMLLAVWELAIHIGGREHHETLLSRVRSWSTRGGNVSHLAAWCQR